LIAVIRPLTTDDWDRWIVLWQGYLDFYRSELPQSTTLRTFDRLCQREDGMFGLVAESDAALTGLVHALVHPSTWSLSGYCYLEDLFVAPAARGTDTGRQLIEAVVAESGARGADKVYWHTQAFNGPARSLYDQVANLSSFVVYERERTR
jgi:GNAT superfamily N-acetyltransferase